MRWQIIVATVSVAACLGVSSPQAGKRDQDAIQGVWELVGGRKDGKDVIKKELKGADIDQMLFKGDETHFKVSNGDWVKLGTFKLDSAQTPKHIDMNFVLGPRKWIYELKDDELRIALDKEKGERPADFKSADVLMVLKRLTK